MHYLDPRKVKNTLQMFSDYTRGINQLLKEQRRLVQEATRDLDRLKISRLRKQLGGLHD